MIHISAQRSNNSVRAHAETEKISRRFTIFRRLENSLVECISKDLVVVFVYAEPGRGQYTAYSVVRYTVRTKPTHTCINIDCVFAIKCNVRCRVIKSTRYDTRCSLNAIERNAPSRPKQELEFQNNQQYNEHWDNNIFFSRPVDCVFWSNVFITRVRIRVRVFANKSAVLYSCWVRMISSG